MPAIPSLPDTERRTRYTGLVSSTGPLDVVFAIYGNSTDFSNWIEVWHNGVLLTPVTDWTLALASTISVAVAARPMTDARITLTTARSGTIDIVSAERPRRTAQLADSQGISAHDFNQVFTQVVGRQREDWDRRSRTLLVPPGETIGTLPTEDERAADGDGSIAGYDEDGDPIVVQILDAGSAAINTSGMAADRLIKSQTATGTILKASRVTVSDAGEVRYLDYVRGMLQTRSNGIIDAIPNIVDVEESGADASGASDNYGAFVTAITTAIAKAPGGTIPAIKIGNPGAYLFTQKVPITVPLIVVANGGSATRLITNGNFAIFEIDTSSARHDGTIIDGIGFQSNNSGTRTSEAAIKTVGTNLMDGFRISNCMNFGTYHFFWQVGTGRLAWSQFLNNQTLGNGANNTEYYIRSPKSFDAANIISGGNIRSNTVGVLIGDGTALGVGDLLINGLNMGGGGTGIRLIGDPTGPPGGAYRSTVIVGPNMQWDAGLTVGCHFSDMANFEVGGLVGGGCSHTFTSCFNYSVKGAGGTSSWSTGIDQQYVEEHQGDASNPSPNHFVRHAHGFNVRSNLGVGAAVSLFDITMTSLDDGVAAAEFTVRTRGLQVSSGLGDVVTHGRITRESSAAPVVTVIEEDGHTAHLAHTFTIASNIVTIVCTTASASNNSKMESEIDVRGHFTSVARRVA